MTIDIDLNLELFKNAFNDPDYIFTSIKSENTQYIIVMKKIDSSIYKNVSYADTVSDEEKKYIFKSGNNFLIVSIIDKFSRKTYTTYPTYKMIVGEIFHTCKICTSQIPLATVMKNKFKRKCDEFKSTVDNAGTATKNDIVDLTHSESEPTFTDNEIEHCRTGKCSIKYFDYIEAAFYYQLEKTYKVKMVHENQDCDKEYFDKTFSYFDTGCIKKYGKNGKLLKIEHWYNNHPTGHWEQWY